MKTVLIVEDEVDISNLLALHLKRDGFKVIQTSNADDALKSLTKESINLALVDWMLPGKTGIELIQEIKTQKINVPILMITARAEASDVVIGLDSGADDYLTKPIDLDVFKARLNALLRRANLSQTQSVLEWGGITLDENEYDAKIDGKKLNLTKSEFKILLNLVQNQGRVLTREQLIKNVQGEGISVISRTIDTHVVGLRKKLGAKAKYIESIRGVGYRIILDGT